MENAPRLRRASRFVYFAQAETVRLIKIGIAVNVPQRLRTLQCGCPDKLVLLGVIRTDDAAGLEEHLHHIFRKHRSHGEWFRPANGILTYIRMQALSLEDDHSAFIHAIGRRMLDALPTGLVSSEMEV